MNGQKYTLMIWYESHPEGKKGMQGKLIARERSSGVGGTKLNL